MANTIELAQKYLPMLDEVYRLSSLTALLDATAVQFAGANKVNVFKTSMQGLADYNRNTGFVSGNINGSWESLELTKDRGRSFMVDRMDNEETLDLAFGTLAGEFIRAHVVPEIDAYRFSKYASTTGILTTTGAALADGDATVKAIDVATAEMDEAEVPGENRVLFITPTQYTAMKSSAKVVTRFATMTDNTINRDFEIFDRMRVIRVPQLRFYTAIDLKDGKTAGQESGGYAKAAAAKNINFMIIHPTAVLQVAKHVLPRIFDPDTNQKADAWQFDYRYYHDAFTYENKTKGIYLHKSA